MSPQAINSESIGINYQRVASVLDNGAEIWGCFKHDKKETVENNAMKLVASEKLKAKEVEIWTYTTLKMNIVLFKQNMY